MPDEKEKKNIKKKADTSPQSDTRKESAKNAKKRRSAKVAKHTTMATVLTVIFIAAVVLVNIIASIIFDRYPLTFDLTENSMYSISDETVDYIKGVKNEINVTVLATETDFSALNEYTLQAAQLLKRYQEYNSNIKVSYIDLLSHPEIASNYPNTDLYDYDIIFETKVPSDSGSDSFQRIKIVKPTALVAWNAEFTEQFKQYYNMTLEELSNYAGADQVLYNFFSGIVGSDAEAAFTSAIMTITDPNPIEVTILTGHKEIAELTYFKQLLSANGYQLSEINILTDEIPESTDLIIIPAPAEDYLDNDIKKISDFLLNDGALEKDALYIASVSQGKTPNLDEFLEEYGLIVESTLIVEGDTSRYYGGVPLYTLPFIESDKYMQDINSDDILLVMPTARPITRLYDEQGMSITEAFLQTSKKAYSCGYDGQGFDMNDVKSKGTQTSLAIGTKAVFTDDEAVPVYYSNVMVIGSDEFLSDGLLQTSSLQNSEYIISILGGMTGKTKTDIIIATKTILGRTFDINEKQASILKWTFQLIIPLTVLIINFIVYKRRKNK